MSENDGSFWSQHSGNLLVGAIGAVGAIAAAVIPIVWNRPAPVPVEVPLEIGPQETTAAASPAAAPTGQKEEDRRPKVVQDLERIQGEWKGVSRQVPEELKARNAARGRPKRSSSLDAEPTVVWDFRGNALTVRIAFGGGQGSTIRGTFGLREDRDGHARLFDFSGKSNMGIEFEWSGVYRWAGDLLEICYRDRSRLLHEGDTGRATAFHTEISKGGGLLVKFKKRPERIGNALR
jgi:hypothetical protein